MAEDSAVALIYNGGLTLMLLVIALGIFVWLTVKSKSLKSFQFQISLFIVIWIIGELADLLQGRQIIGVLPLPSYSQETGLYIHVLAMGLFSAMLWIRFYRSIKTGQKIEGGVHERERE
jgi:hypothetical protein